MRNKSLSSSEKWIIKGIPILFFVGSLMHFLYGFTGKNIIVGIFSPVNESVWEHSKMILFPLIFWWIIYYTVNNKKYNINKDSWFTGCLVALLTSLISVPMLYYFYTEAFGVEILIVDIIILLIALLLGQLLGLHFYRYSKGINSSISIILLLIIVLIFVVFTFNPPHIPIFKDGPTGQYGIVL